MWDDGGPAGTAGLDAIAILHAAGAQPHAVALALDRHEMATGKQADGSVRDMPHSAVQYVRETLGLQVCAIARLTDLLDYLAARPGHDMADHLARVTAYRQRDGVS